MVDHKVIGQEEPMAPARQSTRVVEGPPVAGTRPVPAMAADLGCAWLLWNVLKKRSGERVAAAAFLICALNPAAILNSAAWGQVDSVLTLLLLGTFVLLEEEKPIWAAAVPAERPEATNRAGSTAWLISGKRIRALIRKPV